MNLMPLFRSDFDGPDLSPIVSRLHDGYRVLALDVKIVLFCLRNNIAYTTIEDWIDRESLYQCTVMAHAFERDWFRECRSEFTVGGLCLPDVDSPAMHHFWREAVAASVFMERFFQGGGKDIFIPRNQRQPSVYYYRADTWKTVIERHLSGETNPAGMMERVKSFAGDVRMTDAIIGDARFGRVFESPDNAEPWSGNPMPAGPRGTGKIAFALNPGELDRFEPVIKNLRQTEWGQTAVYITTWNSQTCDALTEKWGIPLLPLPKVSINAARLSAILSSAYEGAGKRCTGRLGQCFDIAYHFRHYCEQRWPFLYAMFQAWQSLWERERPSAVIVSSLNDAESQLPAVAASRFGIDTFSLPHARFLGIDASQHSKFFLYDFVPYRSSLEKIGISPDRIIGCRDFIGSYPYPTHRKVDIPKKALNILALVGNTNGAIDGGDLFVPRVLSTAQIEAIRCLVNPPEALRGSIQIKFKVHPMGAEMEMFEAAGADMEQSVLPTDTDLIEALGTFDLVVDVNNTGTAVLNAIHWEKPLFLWWNGLIKKPNYYVETLLEAGEWVEDGPAFWRLVLRVLNDGAYLNTLIARSKTFKRKYLDADPYPTIDHIFHRHLTGRGTDHRRAGSRGNGRISLADPGERGGQSTDKGSASERLPTGSVREFIPVVPLARESANPVQPFAMQRVVNELTPAPNLLSKGFTMDSLSLKRQKIEGLLPNASSIPYSLIGYKFDYGEILRNELITLCRLIGHHQPRVIFEIGTFMGGTTLQLAAHSNAKVFTLDLPPSGHKDYVDPVTVDPELDVYPAQAGVKFRSSPYSSRISQLFGDSRTFNFSPYYGHVDVVFVDGSHHYEYVIKDSSNALKMIKENGLVIWHDYAEYAPGVVRALNAISKMIPLVHIENTSLVLFDRKKMGHA